MERFMQLRETAFADPKSFFHKLSQMSAEEATAFGLSAWESINMPNLRDNILPTRGRADLILTKGRSHAVEEVALRRL
jgi:type I pantothenate kinase